MDRIVQPEPSGGTVRLRIGPGENATFGKSIEQVRNRVNVRLIADPNKAMKAVAKTTFRHSEIVNADLVMVKGCLLYTSPSPRD